MVSRVSETVPIWFNLIRTEFATPFEIPSARIFLFVQKISSPTISIFFPSSRVRPCEVIDDVDFVEQIGPIGIGERIRFVPSYRGGKPRWGIAATDRDHLMAAPYEQMNQGRPDEARGAGDDSLHGFPPAMRSFLKIECRIPASAMSLLPLWRCRTPRKLRLDRRARSVNSSRYAEHGLPGGGLFPPANRSSRKSWMCLISLT